MNGIRTAIVGVLILGAGFAGGFLAGRAGDGAARRRPVPPPEPAAEEALATLRTWCGQGAKAVRRVLDLVRAAAAGGEGLLPALREAIASAAPWSYDVPGWSLDPRSGEVSVLPTRLTAFLEVAARIGGGGAREILREQAQRAPDWTERAAALLFLVRFPGREEAGAFLAERVRGMLDGRRGDPEAVETLRIACGRLPASSFPKIGGAFEAGWAQEAAAAEMAACLVALDRERAAELFLRTLSDPAGPPLARLAAAAALARLPERRPAAAAVILREKERGFARAFTSALRLGRFDGVDRYREAFESGDPERFRAYNAERLSDMASARQILVEMGAAMGEAEAEAVGIPQLLREFDAATEAARERQRLLDLQRPR